jgi:hypothetical protein
LRKLQSLKDGKTPWWVLAVDLPADADEQVKEPILPGKSLLVESRAVFVLLPPGMKRGKPQLGVFVTAADFCIPNTLLIPSPG